MRFSLQQILKHVACDAQEKLEGRAGEEGRTADCAGGAFKALALLWPKAGLTAFLSTINRILPRIWPNTDFGLQIS